MTPYSNSNNNNGTYDGWNMVWTSQEACVDDTSKQFTVNVHAKCNHDKNAATTLRDVTPSSDTCNAQFNYEGIEGCVDFHMPIMAVLKAVGPFLGIITILMGLLMTYAGAKFLFIVLSLSIAGITTGVSFLVFFNLFIPATASKGVVIGVLLLCFVLGAVVVFLTYKITTKFAAPILAGLCGLMVARAIYSQTGLHIPLVRLIFFVVGFAGGLFLGFKTQGYIKTIGTAFIGANIIVSGISMYAGNLDVPNNAQEMGKIKTAVWGYIAVFVFFFVSGSIVQRRLFADIEKEEDAFHDEDEGKRCGCF